MFMDDEKNERYLVAQELRAKAAATAENNRNRRLGLAVLLVPIATMIWGLPLAVILWRAAIGN